MDICSQSIPNPSRSKLQVLHSLAEKIMLIAILWREFKWYTLLLKTNKAVCSLKYISSSESSFPEYKKPKLKKRMITPVGHPHLNSSLQTPPQPPTTTESDISLNSL